MLFEVAMLCDDTACSITAAEDSMFWGHFFSPLIRESSFLMTMFLQIEILALSLPNMELLCKYEIPRHKPPSQAGQSYASIAVASVYARSPFVSASVPGMR